jgi:hypothetical protein
MKKEYLLAVLLVAVMLSGCVGPYYSGPAGPAYQAVGHVDVLVTDQFGQHIERITVIAETPQYWIWVQGPQPYWNWVGPSFCPGWSWYGPGYEWRWRGHHPRPHHAPPGPPHRGRGHR